MKISQKQASLLAKEVFTELKKRKVGEVPETVIAQIKKFKERRNELLALCKEHDENLRKHETTWRNVVGIVASNKIYLSDSMETMVSKLKELEMPRLQAIEDEIILASMFSSDDDLQSFINKVVKKFDKKTKSKIFSN